jgi:hypothetical protein
MMSGVHRKKELEDLEVIEDLIMKRLTSANFWKVTTDMEAVVSFGQIPGKQH